MANSTGATVLAVGVVAVGAYAAYKLIKKPAASSSGGGGVGGADAFSPYNPYQQQQGNGPSAGLSFGGSGNGQPSNPNAGPLQGADNPDATGESSSAFAKAWDAVNGYDAYDNQTSSQDAADILDGGASLDNADASLLSSPDGQVTDNSPFATAMNNFLNSIATAVGITPVTATDSGLPDGSILANAQAATQAQQDLQVQDADFAGQMVAPNGTSDGSSSGGGNVGGDSGGDTSGGDPGSGDGGGDTGSGDGGGDNYGGDGGDGAFGSGDGGEGGSQDGSDGGGID